MAIELNQIWDFPIKDFHPFPNAKLGVGAHDMLGVEAKNLGMTRVLLMTTGLRGSGELGPVDPWQPPSTFAQSTR